MIMTQKEMLFIVQSQLAIDLNCSIDDLNGVKDSIIFVEARKNPWMQTISEKGTLFRNPVYGKINCSIGYTRTVVNCQNTNVRAKTGIPYSPYHLSEAFTCIFCLM
ncbi:hypothetical protein ACFQ88_11375 [Paenibacillus sp. NPDC056579]|uniref:hypothetical protein n=1 Tax=Paenibacillus sp. NPDC056579 TaxID=3345871 RepID=UPI0036942204